MAGTPGFLRKCVVTKALKVLCFDTLLQVLILEGLRHFSRYQFINKSLIWIALQDGEARFSTGEDYQIINKFVKTHFLGYQTS